MPDYSGLLLEDEEQMRSGSQEDDSVKLHSDINACSISLRTSSSDFVLEE